MNLRATLASLAFWCGIIALCTLAGIGLSQRGVLGPITGPVDFRAFYCGGRAVLAGADPYRVEPLRGCESDVLAAERLRYYEGVVVPTPQPPYALALFSVFAALPFLVASSLWLALALAAWFRTVVLLRDITGFNIVVPLVATYGLGLIASIVYGQMMPLVMWLVVETAAALRAGDDRRAAVLATLATIEPHIGGPVWLAIFILRRGSRASLAIGAAALLAVSLIVLRPERCIEWFALVLPAHAVSELYYPEQFSLTSLLVFAGAGATQARLFGALDYLVTAALSIWVAAKLAASWREPGAIALAPPAFVVLGGVFVHQHQLAAAIPMGLLAFARTRRREFAVALALLAVPWLSVTEQYFPKVHAAYARTRPIALPSVRPSDLSEIVWTAFGNGWTVTPLAELVKLPQWFGVALVVFPLVRLSLGTRDAVSGSEPAEPSPAGTG